MPMERAKGFEFYSVSAPCVGADRPADSMYIPLKLDLYILPYEVGQEVGWIKIHWIK